MKKNIYLSALILLFSISNLCAQPYVIMVSFDAFRWDYLDRGITPTLNQIKIDGVSTLSLQPSFPSKTFPNHQSIITGMYPAHHGIIANNFINPYTNQFYRMRDSSAVQDSRWYLGEAFWETAERHGIKTASYFWPGSEMTLTHRRPTFYEHYDTERPELDRINGVIKWLQMPSEKRPHFINLYFSNTDEAGHSKGPNSSECNEAIKKVDELAAIILKKLEEIKMIDSVNVIFLSDHGMTEVSNDRVVNIEKMITPYKCDFSDEGPTLMVFPQKNEIKNVYEILKKNENHFRVYYREEIPAYYHFSDNDFISPIFLVADMGWSLVSNRFRSEYKMKGNHGYDNHELDMHGIFLAEGPNFKKGYRTGTMRNIDIYPLLCKLFHISPRANIDGDINNVEFLLRQQ